MILQRFEAGTATCETSQNSSMTQSSRSGDEEGPAVCETEVTEYKIRNEVSPKVLCRLKTIESVHKQRPPIGLGLGQRFKMGL